MSVLEQDNEPPLDANEGLVWREEALRRRLADLRDELEGAEAELQQVLLKERKTKEIS